MSVGKDQAPRSAADAFGGEEEHSRRPGLIAYARRLSGLAVALLVEFPPQVQFGQ
jgi:hypothetical protein